MSLFYQNRWLPGGVLAGPLFTRPARPVLQESRQAPKASEAEIRVRAVGLNFRDVLNVMGCSDERIAGQDGSREWWQKPESLENISMNQPWMLPNEVKPSPRVLVLVHRIL